MARGEICCKETAVVRGKPARHSHNNRIPCGIAGGSLEPFRCLKPRCAWAWTPKEENRWRWAAGPGGKRLSHST
jgi:hypothetical protein